MFKYIVIALLIFAAVAVVRAYTASQQESREARTLRGLPPSVQHVVARMDPQAQAALFNEYDRKRKRTSVGYLLWLVGFHYLYYSKVGLFFAYFFTWGGLGFWALVDLFRMHSIARSANEQVARQALQTLGIAGFSALPVQQPAPAPPEVLRDQGQPPLDTTASAWPPDADPPAPPAAEARGRSPVPALPSEQPPAMHKGISSPATSEPGMALREPSPATSRPYLLVGGIAVVALALATAALLIVTQSHPTPAALIRADEPSPSYAVPVTPTIPATSPENPASSEPAAGSSTGVTPPSPTVGMVDISNVASDPRASQIGQTLDQYFSGIDQGQYAQALAVVDPALVDSSDPDQVASFAKGLATSNDSNVAVLAITPDPQAPSGVSADVTFQSVQDPSLGPNGEACSKWNLHYQLSGSPETSFRLYKAHGSQVPC
jgi:hypothetical protein